MVNRLLAFLTDPAGQHHPELMIWLLVYGTIPLVRHLINRAQDTPAGDNGRLGVLRNVNPDWLLPREYIQPSIQIVRFGTEPRRVLVCFTGNGLRPNIALQLYHLHAAKYFDCLIYLRDHRKQRFAEGIVGVASNISGLNAYLAQLIPQGCFISVMGVSGGGLAATRFAESAGANRLLLFSPPLTYKSNSALGARSALDPEAVRLCFANRNGYDRDLAVEWTNTAYAPGIRMLATNSHGTLAYLFSRGGMDDVFRWLRGDIAEPYAAALGEALLHQVSRV